MRSPPHTLRLAAPADGERIAALHALSWRAHYRGAYLDGPVEHERRRVWGDRLDHPRPGQIVVVAEDRGALTGFVCAYADHDAVHGSLVDNLHVVPERKGGGLGRALMRDVAGRLLRTLPFRPVYLHALETNHAAQAFYARLGGQAIERGRETLADGGTRGVVVYTWASPAALRAGTDR